MPPGAESGTVLLGGWLTRLANRTRCWAGRAGHAVRLNVYPSLRVTTSVGAVRAPPELRLADALQSADRALYVAKAHGRDRVHLFDETARAA